MRKRDFPASYPLLGLLTLGPQSGYDLRKTAEATLGAFWHEGFAQVYASLEVFEAQGLAEVVTSEAQSRRRRVYALTARGRQVFQEWLERPVDGVDLRRHELLVKVFFGRLLAPEILAQHLEAYAIQQRRWRGSLEALASRLERDQADHADLPYWLATVDHGVALGRALEAWCEHTQQRLTASRESRA